MGNTVKNPAPSVDDLMEELVEYTAPILPGDGDSTILVSVNGETIRIMRGETVSIKRKFLDVLKNAEQQHMALRRTIQKAQHDAEKATAAL